MKLLERLFNRNIDYAPEHSMDDKYVSDTMVGPNIVIQDIPCPCPDDDEPDEPVDDKCIRCLKNVKEKDTVFCSACWKLFRKNG